MSKVSPHILSSRQTERSLVLLTVPLGKYTCSGILPALLTLCVYICINFLWNMSDDVLLLTCSSPSSLCSASSLSHWQSGWFTLQQCGKLTNVFSLSALVLQVWGYYSSSSSMTDWLTDCFILRNSLNKLVSPLFLLSGYEYSYDLTFWYLGWVFLQCKLPRNISALTVSL